MKLIKWLSVADRYTKIYLDNMLAPLGINSSQHMYLLRICDNPGISQDSLINCFYIHPSNIVRTISTLEKNGFLTRETCENDKRTWRLYPTQKACDIVQTIRDACNEVESVLTKGMSQSEIEELDNTLSNLGKNIAQKLNVYRMEDEFDE